MSKASDERTQKYHDSQVIHTVAAHRNTITILMGKVVPKPQSVRHYGNFNKALEKFRVEMEPFFAQANRISQPAELSAAIDAAAKREEDSKRMPALQAADIQRFRASFTIESIGPLMLIEAEMKLLKEAAESLGEGYGQVKSGIINLREAYNNFMPGLTLNNLRQRAVTAPGACRA